MAKIDAWMVRIIVETGGEDRGEIDFYRSKERAEKAAASERIQLEKLYPGKNMVRVIKTSVDEDGTQFMDDTPEVI